MKIKKIIITVWYIAIAGAMIPIGLLFNNLNHIIAFTCLFIASATFISTIISSEHEKMTYALYTLSLFYLVLSATGFIFKNYEFNVSVYCVLLGLTDLISGFVKAIEAAHELKEGRRIGWLFVIDALIEGTLGVLMCIEKEHTLRTHIVLIASDCIYEGIIKYFKYDEYINYEEEHPNEEHNS